jgi:hypothetical protein
VSSYQQFIGIAGALLSLCANGYYVAAIIRGSVRPMRITWLIWLLIGVLGFTSTRQGGAGPGAYVAGSYVVIYAIVCVLAFTGYGKPGGRRYDLLLGLAAVVALALLAFGKLSPTVGALTAVVADFLAIWPTLRETQRQPETEDLGVWIADTVAAALGLLAVMELTVAAVVYPAYLVMSNGSVVAIVLVARRKISMRLAETNPHGNAGCARRRGCRSAARVLSGEQLREFGDKGYRVLPGVVPEQLPAPADAEIDALVAESPPPAGAVSNHSYFQPHARRRGTCEPIRGSVAIIEIRVTLIEDAEPWRQA